MLDLILASGNMDLVSSLDSGKVRPDVIDLTTLTYTSATPLALSSPPRVRRL